MVATPYASYSFYMRQLDLAEEKLQQMDDGQNTEDILFLLRLFADARRRMDELDDCFDKIQIYHESVDRNAIALKMVRRLGIRLD